MQITRNDFQEPAVYIDNAFCDVLSNLQEAMAKYKQFTETGEFESLIGIRDMLDESLLALSDLAMAVNQNIPDVPKELTQETQLPESEIPF